VRRQLQRNFPQKYLKNVAFFRCAKYVVLRTTLTTHITTNSPQSTTQKTPFLPTPLLKRAHKTEEFACEPGQKKNIRKQGLG
jgi:hypothetical protein